MAEPDAKDATASGASAGPAKAPKPQNPVFRMMGLPNIRMKLPSRNWCIFWGIVGSWTAAVQYDRYEKRRIHRKYARLVEHIAQEPLDAQQLPRKLSIYISAPPADGLVSAREHFTEYVKPILVAAALDWDAVEGRREGDVRAGLAERIRKLRYKRGEKANEPIELGTEDDIEELRQRSGVKGWDGPAGDIVVGRHTWKEYVRGLHEGWLGPLDPPAPAELPVELAAPAVESAPAPTPAPTEAAPEALAATATTVHSSTTATPEAPKTEEAEKPKEEEKKDKKKKQPAPFNTTADYEHSAVAPTCPRSLGPTAIVPLPHLLGFWNFPIRIYRYLNKRAVAEEVGRETAAAVLGAFRSFEAAGEASSEDDSSAQWEQQGILAHEESNWHKSTRERKDDNGKERVWLDDMVLDPRIAERMKRFVLEPEAEDRAKNINTSSDHSWIKSLWPAEKKKPMWEGLAEDE
ncbi:mitochondrial import inner membrane translocase subunit tim54 [Macroventuria anomochaeta]|uniref:Mitochondrial import inner membrane translocase subunit tim54 n=1 Tax=Macroventuria anomochaeta TaxID=301207 RepID=A0ACB6RJT8_9PLEO|nr:mitochondrial import inner membrane translocase subunit tim54 [Macroventuria anomochaeta]KAF2622170.1 mitochondrial import inner membrane translocase subunit tim54 [Macroventuria anomochaeta]